MATINRPYKIVNGERVTLTQREVKSFIMSVNNWTEQQYNAERYKLKNKLRTYEAYTNVKPADVQSPTNILYFEAKRKKREGANYQQSAEMSRLKGFTGYGSSKAIQKALSSTKSKSTLDQIYEQGTYNRFEGFIKKNTKAKEIYDAISDPVKREQALRDYANKVHEKIDEQRKATESEAIPIPTGETYGSDLELDDFDYSSYI